MTAIDDKAEWETMMDDTKCANRREPLTRLSGLPRNSQVVYRWFLNLDLRWLFGIGLFIKTLDGRTSMMLVRLSCDVDQSYTPIQSYVQTWNT